MKCYVVDENRKAELEKIDIPVPIPQARIVKYDLDVSGKVELTEAEVIVSGGRGMKDAANYAILEELAGLLGAAVGPRAPRSIQAGVLIRTRSGRPERW